MSLQQVCTVCFKAASYMHPMEFVLTDSIPKSAAPLLLGSHPVTLWLWHLLANLYTINSHSGYHLPFLPSNENHDFHHYRWCFTAYNL